jgi:FHS family glucose/mannose:H+ symporter-like MFS transporter
MNRRPLFTAACGAMFVFGIVLAILGALFGMPEFRTRLDISLAEQGNILLLLFFGVFVSTIVVGPIIDRFGNKVVLTLSAALVTASLVIFSVATTFVAAAAAAFLLGLGGGGLNTSSNALVADLYPERRGAMLNILGTFFGFGALFIPLLAASITGVFTISQLWLIAAALSGALTVAYLVLGFPQPTQSTGFSIFASLKAASYPGVMLFAFLLFFQSGNESSIGGWTSTYVLSLGESARSATWILSGYWAALMVGRVVSAQIVDRLGKVQLVLLSGVGSAIGTAILIASESLFGLAAGAIIVGFSFAAIYPTTLAIAADRYQKMAGTIFGLLFSVGLIGGMSFPWAVGHISQRYGLRTGMVLPLFGALMIALLATRAGSAPLPAPRGEGH